MEFLVAILLGVFVIFPLMHSCDQKVRTIADKNHQSYCEIQYKKCISTKAPKWYCLQENNNKGCE